MECTVYDRTLNKRYHQDVIFLVIRQNISNTKIKSFLVLRRNIELNTVIKPNSL